MVRPLSVFVGLLLLMCRCAYQPTVCPAYQSAYIYDQDQLRKRFSYFVGDTTPKIYATNKSKYLVIEPTTYKKRERSLQTVEKKAVMVVVPDSLRPGAIAASDFATAERNVNDSTAVIRIDTVAAPRKPAKPEPGTDDYKITKERELLLLKYDNRRRSYWVDTLGYNSEQDNYMWYLRHVLVLPDAKIAQRESGGGEGTGKKSAGKSQKKGGLLKRRTEKADSVDTFEPTTSATIVPGTKTKRAKKKKDQPSPVTTPPAKKEEDEDDGF